MVQKSSNQDDWPAERKGYEEVRPQIAYANVPAETGPAPRRLGFSPTLEACIGVCILGAGLVWFTRSALATGAFNDLSSVNIASIITAAPRGSFETAGVGALIWLHAKWRRSMSFR